MPGFIAEQLLHAVLGRYRSDRPVASYLGQIISAAINPHWQPSHFSLCGPGQTVCFRGWRGWCKSLDSDPSSCGSCGNICPPGTSCVRGTCVCGGKTCPPGAFCEGGYCVYFSLYSFSCGACSPPNYACCGDDLCLKRDHQWCANTCTDINGKHHGKPCACRYDWCVDPSDPADPDHLGKFVLNSDPNTNPCKVFERFDPRRHYNWYRQLC